MIGFLYPVLGLAALTAIVPIILHLIRRRELQRQSFPAIRYLRRAEQRYARRLRLRHLALLATRVAVILLASAAAAGLLLGRGGAADHRATGLAIVIDQSLSSGRLAGEQRLLDLYAERARLALAFLGPDDRVGLFSAVAPADGPVATDLGGGREFIAGLRPAAARADLTAALRQAEAWLATPDDLAREIHVYTDLQRVSLPLTSEVPASPPSLGRDVSVVVFDPGVADQPNGAIGDATPDVLPLTSGRETLLSVPLRWFGGPAPAEPVTVRLAIAEEIVAVADGEFGRTALLRLPPRERGWVQGRVEIARYGMPSDDRRYFSWPVRPPVRVAVRGEPGPFLASAIDALEHGGRLEIVGAPDAEVWLSAAGAGLDAAPAAAASLVVIPSHDPLDLPRLNDRLHRAGIPWRYTPAGTGGGVARIAGEPPLEELTGLEVRNAYRLTAAGLARNGTTIIVLSTGAPWLVGGVGPNGLPYLLFASPLDERASDLPASAAMLPFVDALLGDWARRRPFEPSVLDGPARVRLPSRARELRGPDGTRRPVEGGAWFHASEAGNYAVLDGAEVLLAFSLNAPLVEADLARGQRSALESVLPAATWHWLDDDRLRAWEAGIFRARRGTNVWRPLVALILLVSIFEAGLAAAGRRTERAGRSG